MDHPVDLELELVHLGEPDPGVSQHVAGCARCQRFLQSLQDAKEATWRQRSPEDYALWLRQRRHEQSAGRRPLSRWLSSHWLSSHWLSSHWLSSYWLSRASGGLAVAAGVALLATMVLRSESELSSDPEPASDSRLLAARGAEPAPQGQGTGQALVPRGSAGLSVLRVRDGETQIFREVVPVAPADTIALQFHLDRAEKISAGILTETGEWAPFFSDLQLAAGTHVPELTLQVNDEPGSGVLLLGPSAQVEAVKRGEAASGVQSARISWSAEP